MSSRLVKVKRPTATTATKPEMEAGLDRLRPTFTLVHGPLPSMTNGAESSDDSSAFEAVGLGLRSVKDEEHDEVTREDRLEYKRALDEFKPPPSPVALKKRAPAPSLNPQTIQYQQPQRVVTNAEEKVAPASPPAPTFLLIFCLLVLAVALVFLALGSFASLLLCYFSDFQ